MRVRIYGLKDPRDGKIRYVGKTSAPLSVRLQGHVDVARRHPESGRVVSGWIRELLAWELTPIIVLLESVPVEQWRQAERAWGQRLNAKTRLANVLTHLGNGPATSYTARWTPELENRLGRDPDNVIAKDMGITRKAVSYRRAVLGIPAQTAVHGNGKPPPMGGHNRITLPDAIVERLGKEPDYVLSRRAGVAKGVIARVRCQLGIAAYADQSGHNGRYLPGCSHRTGWRKNKDGWYRLTDAESERASVDRTVRPAEPDLDTATGATD